LHSCSPCLNSSAWALPMDRPEPVSFFSPGDRDTLS
jgi:hypothetical protein